MGDPRHWQNAGITCGEWLVYWWVSQFLLHLSQPMSGGMSKAQSQYLVWKKPLSRKCQSMRCGVRCFGPGTGCQCNSCPYPPVQEQPAFPPGKAHGDPCSLPHSLQLPGRTACGGILVFKEGKGSMLTLEHGEKEGSALKLMP